jgi:hypothetical protein
VTSRDVTVPGKTARGLFIKSLTTHDVANVEPLRAYPVVDLKAHEPDPDVQNIFFPANFATLLRTGSQASASIVAGQFRPNTVGNPNLGTQRLVDEIRLDVSYVNSSSTPTDSLPPQILQVGGVIVGDDTRFFVRATDSPGPIQKVAVLYNTGTQVWGYKELTHQSGDLWTGLVEGLADPGVQIIAQARDASGLTGIGANKAVNYISSVDQTNPSIQIDLPAAGAAFALNQQVTPKFTCSDAGAIDGCTGQVLVSPGRLDTSTVGEHTFTVTATDLAGNETMKSVKYFVHYTFIGFKPPVDNPPTINVAALGSTIPIKWSLTNAAGQFITSLSTVTSLTSESIRCPDSGIDRIEETTTPAFPPLKYDTSGQQFVYRWHTLQSWGFGCRRLYVALADGTVHTADFYLGRGDEGEDDIGDG